MLKAVLFATACASAAAFAPAGIPLSAGLKHSAVSTASSRLAAAAPMRSAARLTGLSMALKSVPHGGKLTENMVKDDAKKAELAKACDFEMQLNERQLCDVELIMNGGLSPLTGFMDEKTYQNVVDNMRLPGSDLLFGLPIVFDTDDERMVPGKTVLLKYGDRDIATFKISDRYMPDKVNECKQCYGETTLEHPGVLMVATQRGAYYCGGEVTGLNLPVRDFPCKTPAEVRAELPEDVDVVAFQCRNPIHRAHYELFTRALDAPEVGEGGVVLVHPTCGPTQADDISGVTRYKTYVVLSEETANPRTRWEYLPYSMHMAGPREAIQHMMIRKNFGCTHFIIGRDMAGSKSSITGDDFYGPYDAQDFAKKHGPELGMTPVPSLNLVYTEEKDYVTAEEAEAEKLTLKKLSGTAFRKMLRAGEDIPEWFAFKSVVKVLREEEMKK